MADKKYESLKIENIVASGVVAESIDLVAFSDKVENCEQHRITIFSIFKDSYFLSAIFYSMIFSES